MEEIVAKFREALNSTDNKTYTRTVNGAMIALRNADRDLYGQALNILTSKGKDSNAVAEIIKLLDGNVEESTLEESTEYCLVLPGITTDEEANSIVEMLKEKGIEAYFFTR